MNHEVYTLIADDDMGHATLIRRNLKRMGLSNPIIHFKDGQEVLNYLFNHSNSDFKNGKSYVLLLDIRMPKVDGIEVLRRIKENSILKTIPVIIITTTDDPRDIEQCFSLGCSSYIVKPVKYEKFTESIRQLGLFIEVNKVPVLNEINPCLEKGN